MNEQDKIGASRRRFLATLGSATALSGFPTIVKSQARAPVKVGVMHPVTGFLSYSGGQCRAGALMAIRDVNAAGGIKSLGGRPLEAVLADSQSKVDVAASEMEKLNEQGISAFVGPYASAHAIATGAAASRHGIPHIADVAVSDRVIGADKPTVFRFSPGYTQIAREAIGHLANINKAAGNPSKTVMLIHEESESGAGTQAQLAKELPTQGFEIVERVLHANPTRDFTNIVLRVRQRNPDLLIIGNYYEEYVLLVRTLRQQRVRVKGIYSVLGGGASSYKFLREFPDAAQHVMDCNHWFNPKSQAARDLRKRCEAEGRDFSYEFYLNYNAVMLLADALERAKSSDRAAIVAALKSSTFNNQMLPYGPTRFVDGQNTGARSVILQIQGKEIEVVLPQEFASAKLVYPVPA